MTGAKVSFWQLTFVFLLLTMLALMNAWSTVEPPASGMMGQMMGMSMGEMMRMMHATNITLLDLLHWRSEQASSNMGMADQNMFLMWVNNFTTNLVFLLAPLILAGTVFLLIVWHC